MEQYFQIVAGVLLAVVLILSLQKQGQETALLLSVFVCCMVGCLAVGYLRPVLNFIRKLESVGSLDSEMLGTLLKVIGIALIAEISSLICSDSGNSAMGKALQFLASAVIVWLSLPMLTALLNLVEGILGNI